jgi:hypothetical protein
LKESVGKVIEVKNKDYDEKQQTAQQKASTELKKQTSVLEIKLEAESKQSPKETKPVNETKSKEKKIISKKSTELEQRKERALTKEERLAGLQVAYEEEPQVKSFRLRDLYIYIVLIVLLVFVAIMAIFAYNLNPIG